MRVFGLLPQGTYTPSPASTSVWTYNPNAGVQTGIPQGGHAKGAINSTYKELLL